MTSLKRTLRRATSLIVLASVLALLLFSSQDIRRVNAADDYDELVDQTLMPLIAVSFDEVVVLRPNGFTLVSDLGKEYDLRTTALEGKAFFFTPVEQLEEGYYTLTITAKGKYTGKVSIITRRIKVKLKPLTVTIAAPNYGGDAARQFTLRIKTARPASACRWGGGFNNIPLVPYSTMKPFENVDDTYFTYPIDIQGDPASGGDSVRQEIYVKCNDTYGNLFYYDDATKKSYEPFTKLVLEYNPSAPSISFTPDPDPVIENDRTTEFMVESDDEVYCRFTDNPTHSFAQMKGEFTSHATGPALHNLWRQFYNLPQPLDQQYTPFDYFSRSPTQEVSFFRDGYFTYYVQCVNRANQLSSKISYELYVNSSAKPGIIRKLPQGYVSVKTIDLQVYTSKDAVCYVNKDNIEEDPPIAVGDQRPSNVHLLNYNGNMKKFIRKSVVLPDRLGEYRIPVLCYMIADGLAVKDYITFTYDNTAPAKPQVSAEQPHLGWPGFVSYTDQIHATVNSSDPESGIAFYNATVYQCGTGSNTNITRWRTFEADYDKERGYETGYWFRFEDWEDWDNTPLTNGSSYKIKALAQNKAGLWSDAAESACVQVDDSLKPKESRPPKGQLNITKLSDGLRIEILCGDNVGGSGCDPSRYTYGFSEANDEYGCIDDKERYSAPFTVDSFELPMYICYKVYDKSRNYFQNTTFLEWETTVAKQQFQCYDGVDNDNDGYIDLSDPGCMDENDDSESPNPTPLPQCFDGLDNDGDGMYDLQDPGCSKASDTTESPDPATPPACADGMDNDVDKLVDLQDPGCHAAGDTDERNYLKITPECSDLKDNDADYLTDLRDPGCYGAFDNLEEDDVSGRQCMNGIDDDTDKLSDIQDPGCFAASDNDETDIPGYTPACNNALDDDYDELTDLADSGCFAASDNDESGDIKGECNDGIDNDKDGDIDLADLGCNGAADLVEDDGDKTVCVDGIDNDQDDKTDYPEDRGCWGAADQAEYPDPPEAFDPDKDKDGMPDAWEVQVGLDPKRNDALEDPDDDGLTNIAEYRVRDAYGQSSNPKDADTDKDGWKDGKEVEKSHSPVDPKDHPTPWWVIFLWVLLILLLLGGGGYVGWYYYNQYQQKQLALQRQQMTRRRPMAPMPSLHKTPINMEELRERQRKIREMIEKKKQAKYDKRDKLFTGFGERKEEQEKEEEVVDLSKLTEEERKKRLMEGGIWKRLGKFVGYSKGREQVAEDEVFSKKTIGKEEEKPQEKEEKTQKAVSAMDRLSSLKKDVNDEKTSPLDRLKEEAAKVKEPKDTPVQDSVVPKKKKSALEELKKELAEMNKSGTKTPPKGKAN